LAAFLYKYHIIPFLVGLLLPKAYLPKDKPLYPMLKNATSQHLCIPRTRIQIAAILGLHRDTLTRYLKRDGLHVPYRMFTLQESHRILKKYGAEKHAKKVQDYISKEENLENFPS